MYLHLELQSSGYLEELNRPISTNQASGFPGQMCLLSMGLVIVEKTEVLHRSLTDLMTMNMERPGEVRLS